MVARDRISILAALLCLGCHPDWEGPIVNEAAVECRQGTFLVCGYILSGTRPLENVGYTVYRDGDYHFGGNLEEDSSGRCPGFSVGEAWGIEIISTASDIDCSQFERYSVQVETYDTAGRGDDELCVVWLAPDESNGLEYPLCRSWYD